MSMGGLRRGASRIDVRNKSRRDCRRLQSRRMFLEALESRQLLASDLGYADPLSGTPAEPTGTVTGEFASSISGTTWIDADGDGSRGSGELPMVGVTVYLDANNDGQLQATERSAVTDAAGGYLFSDVSIGTHIVREIIPADYRQTSPGMQRDYYYATDAFANHTLVQIDATSGLVTRIGTGLRAPIVGLALTDSGDLYGITGNEFFSINRDTGVATRVGHIGANAGFGLCYDSETDTIWGIASRVGGGNGLVRYDRVTGAAIPVGGSISNLTATSGIAFDPTTDRIVVFDNSDDEFWAFDRLGAATRLSISAFPPALNNFALTHNGAGLVMFDGNTNNTLHLVNPATNAKSAPLVTLSQTFGTNSIEFVNVESFAQVVTVLAGETVDGLDFGNQSVLGEIRGSKWNDADGDGLRDAAEEALAGLTVYLDLNNDGQLQETEPATVTGADGSYAFAGVLPGTYQVREIIPENYRQTAPGAQHDYYFGIDSQRNFQLVKIDALTGEVTRIGNGVGAPLSGIARTGSGRLYGVTAGPGAQFYSIDPLTGLATRIGAVGRDLVGGLAHDPETDTFFSAARTANVFSLVSIDRQSGMATVIGPGTPLITSPAAVAFNTQTNQIVVLDNFDRELVAFTRTGVGSSLGFIQSNSQGMTQDGSELHIFFSGAFHAITPNGGRRLLTVPRESLNLTSIEYVNLEPFAHTVLLEPAGAVTGIDFGNQFVLADISGSKWNDLDGDGVRDVGEPAMAGVTIYLDRNDNGSLDEGEESVITAEDGSYRFENVQPDSHLVREIIPYGYQQTRPGVQADFYYAVRFGRELVKVDPSTGQSTFIGVIGSPPFHGLVHTNAGELYAISGPENTLWRVDPNTGFGTRIGPTGATIAWGLAYDAATDTIYGLANPPDGNASLVNLVTFDRESGRATPIGSGISGMSGTSGITFDPISRRIIAFDNSDREFYAFSTTGVGTRLSTMPFGTGALTTDGLGRVVFESGGRLFAVNPDNGQFTVVANFFPSVIDALEFVNKPDFAHLVFVPPATDVGGVDFGNEYVAGEIRGSKWNDLDQDGIRDADEPGLAGVQIYLDLNLSGSLEAGEPVQTTDAGGNYVFSEILPGPYTVREVVPEAFVQSAPGALPDYFYGLNYGRELVRIEGATGLVESVGQTNIGPNLHGLVRTNSGQLFALSGWDNSLYSINPATGQATLVGSAGRPVAWGLAYDPIGDTLYGLAHPSPADTSTVGLVQFDRATGASTLIGPAYTDVQSTLGLTFNVVTQQIIAFDNNGRQVWAFDRQGNRELLGAFPQLNLDFGLASTPQGDLIVKREGSLELSRLNLANGTLTPVVQLSRGLLLEALELVDRPDFAHQLMLGKREVASGHDFGNYNPAPTLTTLDVSPTEIDENGEVGLVGSFVDVGSEVRTVEITWGDGTTETISLSGELRQFSASHRYLDDGTNRVSVRVVDSAGGVAETIDQPGSGQLVSPTVTVVNVAPQVSVQADATAIDENGLVTLMIDIADIGTLDTHTVEINWGDGSETEVVTLASGTRTVEISHRFLDDDPTATSSDSYTVSVVAIDDGAGISDVASQAILVSNVAPLINSLATSATLEGAAAQGQAVTISGAFTDLGTLDDHTVSIDWGDGQTTVTLLARGAREFDLSHTYASGGIYQVAVTLLDDDGGQAAETTESVVQGIGLVNGVLYIIGTAGDDYALVHETGSASNRQIRVDALFGAGWSDQQNLQYGSASLNRSQVQQIVAYLGLGDDIAIIAEVDKPVRLHGDAGDDYLYGGGGPSILMGGAGNDHLYGGGGQDFLIGGEGGDHLQGNSSDDLLIAGTTAFDDDEEALVSLMAEWNSSRSYGTRVANLRDGSGGGDRLNGNLFLQASGPNQTVFDDDDADFLSGASGLDWFFATLDDDRAQSKRDELLEEIE